MKRGAYNRTRKISSKKAMSVPIKIRFAFKLAIKLQKLIINRIDFNAS